MNTEERLAVLENFMTVHMEFARTAMQDSQNKTQAIRLLQEEVFQLKAQVQVLSGEVAVLLSGRES